MKKNKTIAYALAATLLVGGTFLGTKALFTDKIDTVGELSISTGDVDIDAKVVQDWTLDRNGEEPNTGTPDPSGNILLAKFDNLKTGDVLTKKVNLTNKGTLKAVVDFKRDSNVKLPDGIKYTATYTDNKGNKLEETEDLLMNIGESATIDFKIEVLGGGQHNNQGSLNSDEQEKTIINLNDSYILDAVQQNPDEIK